MPCCDFPDRDDRSDAKGLSHTGKRYILHGKTWAQAAAPLTGQQPRFSTGSEVNFDSRLSIEFRNSGDEPYLIGLVPPANPGIFDWDEVVHHFSHSFELLWLVWSTNERSIQSA